MTPDYYLRKKKGNKTWHIWPLHSVAHTPLCGNGRKRLQKLAITPNDQETLDEWVKSELTCKTCVEAMQREQVLLAAKENKRA